jgi:RNA-binding protein Luc7-like 2
MYMRYFEDAYHTNYIIFIQAEVIHAIGEQIGTRLAKAEELGAEGNVEESITFMGEVEELKKKKASAEVST